jgi:hypothetical protein
MSNKEVIIMSLFCFIIWFILFCGFNNYIQDQKQITDNFCQIGNNYAEALKITIDILEESSEKYNFTAEDKMLIYILAQQEIETINCSEYLE